MPSDLATALIQGNASGLAADPMMAQIAPEFTLAQNLAQQGLSTAPAYPMQALGRLAQTLASVKMMHDATSDLQGIYGGSAEEMGKIFPPGTQMGDALRSSSPMVRMLAMQNAGKALLLNSENQKVGPEQTIVAPATPRQGGGVVAAGSPGQAGAVEAAKNPALIQRAGGTAAAENPALIARAGGVAAAENPALVARAGQTEAARNPALVQRAGAVKAAEAPYEAGGEGVVHGPNGPVTIPITAATRAGMQPQPRDEQVISPPGAAGLHLPAAPGGAAAPAQQPASFAERFAPTGVTGAPLKNPAIDPAVAADTKEVAADREKAIAGQQDMATVRMIQDFMPKVQTGWSAESKLEAARILKDGLGVSDDKIKDFLHTDVASGQILQKKFLELSSAAARTMGAREPGSVIQMFAKAYPSLGTDPQAVKLQTNALYMDRVRSQAMAREKTNYLNDSINGVQSSGQYRGLKGFNEAFDQAHPSERYLSASEAMSGVPAPWKRIKDPAEQNAVIDLIPSGTTYMSPDNKMRIKP